MEKSYSNIIETLLIIYASDEGKLKIYLQKKEEEPYKGHWLLPSNFLNNKTTIEENVLEIYKNMTGLNKGKVYQSKIFSDINRNSNKRVIGVSYVAITDKQLTEIKQNEKNNSWFAIDALPKMGFDHAFIIEEVTNDIKRKIISNYDDILLDFFPSDFTLPELQNFYESVSEKKIDRRNFHKKFVSQNLVVDTGFKTSRKNGRPGTLYRFNIEKMKGKRI